MAGNGEREHDFGRWLQSWRHDNRLTQKQLAATLGYDVTYLVKIEGGARSPSRPFLARLAQVTGEEKETLLHASTDKDARSALPCPPDLLIGRDADVEKVVSLLTGPARCVTLVGPPGIGKTRLAIELAARLNGRFLSGVRWVSLLDVKRADDVPAHVQRELGLTDRTAGHPEEAIAGGLRDQHMLVVLDNFEHLISARTLVARLIAETPRVSVLVTSREPLGLLSEHLYPVPPLGVPDAEAEESLDQVASSAAVELFVTRALMAWPHFRLTAANCGAVARACARLDGIPLAIVLAAGLVRTSDPRTIDDRIGQLDIAGVAPVDLPAHHGTLSHAIAGSWQLLDDDEKRTFARLAIFSGGCTPEAAAAVCGSADAWRHLASLSRQSLLEARPDAPAGPRFEFLETIRAFALARLQESGEAADARRRHVDHFAGMARERSQGLLGTQQAHCADALAADFENLRSAFDWALAEAPSTALDLAESLWRFMLLTDPLTGGRWLETALGAVPEPTPLRAAALAGAGALAWVTGRFEVAARSLAAGLALAECLELPGVAALSLLNQGALADQLDRLDEADACFDRALLLYGDDGRGKASALVGKGWIHRRRDQLDLAWPLWIEAAALFRGVGDSYNEAKTLSNLGWAAEARRDYTEAEEWMDACHRVQRTLRDARGLAITEAALGRIAYRRGRLGEARERQTGALRDFQRLGERRRAVEVLILLSGLEVAEDRHHRALRLLGAAEAELERMGAQLSDDQAFYVEVMDACQRRVEPDAARRHLAYGRTLSLDDAVALMSDATANGRRPKVPAARNPRPFVPAR